MKKILLVLSFFLPSLAWGQLQEWPQGGAITFGGGVDYNTVCSEVRVDRACDQNNMVSTSFKAAMKRNGSHRFIETAYSTYPVTSLYRSYITSGTTARKTLFMTSGDRIAISTSDTGPSWKTISTAATFGQTYEYATINNKVILTGDGLVDPVWTYNVITASLSPLMAHDGDTSTVKLYARHLFHTRGYLICGNVVEVASMTGIDSTAEYYPSRIYYSLLVNPSSMTATRWIDVKPEDGEAVQRVTELNGYVHIWKENTVHELDFTVLNNFSLGGDWTLRPKADFGTIAYRTVVNTGDFYIFLSNDGIRMWDGGRRSRLTVTEESRVISGPVQPIIDRIIREGTFGTANAVYYPKKQWYIFSYCDPDKYPKDIPNSALVYDMTNGEWYPFDNWDAMSLVAYNGVNDKGELFYGDSHDGYIYKADVETDPNDARKEMPISSMDNPGLWLRAVPEPSIVKEGTGAIKIPVDPTIKIASITYMKVFNFGDWPDNTKTSLNDKISFRVYPTTIAAIGKLRIDLEINNPSDEFDTNITSVTLSSASFTEGEGAWTTIELALSSFPIVPQWVDIASESFVFAKTLTYYGIRFVATGTDGCSVLIDDLRLVGDKERPLNAFRITPQYNMGTSASKRFRQLILNTVKDDDSSFAIDFFTDFGEKTSRDEIEADVGKEIFVTGYGGVEGVYRLDSNTFDLLESTQSSDRSYRAPRPMVVDRDYIFVGDQYNNRLLKLTKSSMSEIVEELGGLGSGTTAFDGIFQIAMDDEKLYIADFFNHRVKIHDKDDLSYIDAYGTIGNDATSYYCPTGVAVDKSYLYVANDGNRKITKVSKSTGGFVMESSLNVNTVGNPTLAVDEEFLYVFYNNTAFTSFSAQDCYLEKRYKSDLSLIQKKRIREDGTALSTFCVTGDISLGGRYIYLSYTDDVTKNGYSYLEKRLKNDFALVKRVKYSNLNFAVAVDGQSYDPSRKSVVTNIGLDGQYIQVKYSDNSLDNTMNLFNQMFILIQNAVEEK